MSKQYGVRLAEADAEILERLAEEVGLTPSDFIRKELRSLSPKFKGEVSPRGYPKGVPRTRALRRAEIASVAIGDEIS